MNESSQDVEHLRLLTIFHYVFAGITALFSCFPIIHVVIGILMLSGKMGHGQNPPRAVGFIFLIAGLFIILLGWALAGCMFLVGRNLAARKNYTFCFVAAAIECIFVPIGTVLGVFSILVLQRPSVKTLFQVPAQ